MFCSRGGNASGTALCYQSLQSVGKQRVGDTFRADRPVGPVRKRVRGWTNGLGLWGWRWCSPWRAALSWPGTSGTAGRRCAGAAAEPGRRRAGITANAVKKPVPLQVEALGTVTTMASVAIKPRVETEIVAVKFNDGAMRQAGRVLFMLDGRAIEAEISASRRDRRRQGAVRAERARPRTLQRTGSKERHHPGPAQQHADPGPCLARRVELQLGQDPKPQGAARPLHHPCADPAASAWPRSRSAISCGRPTSRRSPPSTRSRRSTWRSRCRRKPAALREALAAETATLEAIIPG